MLFRQVFRLSLFLAIGLLGSALAGAQQFTTYTINPLGDNAPAEIKDLKLSFQLNSRDLIAPSILFTDDGNLGFVNYLSSATMINEQPAGYVLVFRPKETDPAKQFVKAIQVGLRPGLMFLNPTRSEVWVVNLGRYGSSTNADCSISIIDVNTLEVAATIPVPEDHFGFGSNIVFAPGGAFAYISSTYDDQVLKIDTVQRSITGRLALAPVQPYFYTSVGPSWITPSHDGTFLCVVNTVNETVSIINLDTFTERFQVVFREGTDTTPNFMYRNNVLLAADDKAGFVASIGAASSLFSADAIFKFDPVTGKKIKDTGDADGDKNVTEDLTYSVEDNPSTLQLDPTGQYLIVNLYSSTRSVASGIEIGNPAVTVYKWPEMQLFKTVQYSFETYNLASTCNLDWVDNGDGTFDIIFPSYTTTIGATEDHECVIRAPMGLYEKCTSVQEIGDKKVRELPCNILKIPGAAKYLVTNFLSGAMVVVDPPPKFTYSQVPSIFVEDTRFSSVAFLNPDDTEVTFLMQAYQTDNNQWDNDDGDLGVPFYWVGTDNVAHIIPLAELKLAPGQQYVRMFQDLHSDYSKVKNQHGFLKVVHEDRSLHGLAFNGVFNSARTIIRGDYLRIGAPMFQDAIFPFLTSFGSLENTMHYSNPYQNRYHLQQFNHDADGNASVALSGYAVPESAGFDNTGSDIINQGYIRIMNLDNLPSDAYMTVEYDTTKSTYLFTCPPASTASLSSTVPLLVPYYAVGNGYDTSVILISTNPSTDPNIKDANGNLIPQKTHIKMEFLDFQGQVTAVKEFDPVNMSRFEISLSEEKALNHGRYSATILSGSIRITCGRDNVVGAMVLRQSYREVNATDATKYDEYVRNAAADIIPLQSTARESFIFPFTINIPPYQTSYSILNPNPSPATVKIELFDSNGVLVGVSQHDQTIPPLGSLIFFLGDQAIFGTLPELQNFVGYMRVISTNGQPLIGESVQATPETLAIIPTI